ncbi:hypothetical protein F5880DRAFT_1603014 [Lentinula raphanica]|nr:hypothetical protein F5880DRAFT_1603014 [Lentinula raphanica]
MARSVSVTSVKDNKNDKTRAQTDDGKSVDMNGDDAANDANGEDEEEEEEYEIEEILKHEKGRFPEGRLGYFVKWKNYGPEDNSWVDELDASNAQELIDNYWRKKNAQTSARKGRKSIAAESPEPSKKRRKSLKEDIEQDEEDQSSKKKRAIRKKSETFESEPEPEEEEENSSVANESFMQRYMSKMSWETLISRVDTVEKPNDSDELIVYFRLKKDDRRVRLPAKLCNQKFPQLMLGFYEANLKWKETEMDIDSEPLS